MDVVIFLLIAAFLVFLNGFFVLAEFAAVKVRPTQVQVLARQGHKGALRAQKILTHLDMYLSVCQVGITVASIGLGFVGEPAFVRLLQPGLEGLLGHQEGAEMAAHALAFVLGFTIVSFLHIVLGELLPKSIAIRSPQKSVLLISLPMIFFRWIFALPIWLLNSTVNLILRMMKIPVKAEAQPHSEGEIRAILDHSEEGGVLSFRSLLVLENVLDFQNLTVRNAMRVKKNVRTLLVTWTLEEAREAARQSKYSRYPVVSPGGEPLGFVHLKDLYFAGENTPLEDLVKSCPQVFEKDSLEPILAQMQRKGEHLALVYSAPNHWTGIITLEDILEEVIGTIEEEYPVEPSANLSEFLSPQRIVLEVPGRHIVEAVKHGLDRVDPAQLTAPKDRILKAVADREALGPSIMGHHLAIPHARLEGIQDPAVLIFRMAEEIPAPSGKPEEAVQVLFLLITPADSPRIHQILLSHIGGIYFSEYLEARLWDAEDPGEIYDTVVTAELTALA